MCVYNFHIYAILWQGRSTYEIKYVMQMEKYYHRERYLSRSYHGDILDTSQHNGQEEIDRLA